MSLSNVEHMVNWLAAIKRELTRHNTAADGDPYGHPDEIGQVKFTEQDIAAILGGAAATGSAVVIEANRG